MGKSGGDGVLDDGLDRTPLPVSCRAVFDYCPHGDAPVSTVGDTSAWQHIRVDESVDVLPGDPEQFRRLCRAHLSAMAHDRDGVAGIQRIRGRNQRLDERRRQLNLLTADPDHDRRALAAHEFQNGVNLRLFLDFGSDLGNGIQSHAVNLPQHAIPATTRVDGS